MSGGKETPRQKMIGMMYLVLTAMLALNVSVEILKSFLIVNEAVRETNEVFIKKVDNQYLMFEKAYLANPEKVGENWEKAKKAKEISKTMFDYVEDLRINLIAYCENVPYERAKEMSAHEIKAQDNYDKPSQFLIGQSESGVGGRAEALKNKLNEYRSEMLSLLSPGDQEKINIAIETAGPYYNASGQEVNWEVMFFSKTIIVANITILNKIKTDILNTEFDVVAQLYTSVSDEDFKFDNIEAKVVPASNYILVGGEYEAEIFVAAYDSKSNITATIGGQSYSGENGRIKFTRPASSVGNQSINGVINVQSGFGIKSYDFNMAYTVAPPMATVSADAMNVMYIGVNNPITAIAGGGTDENTRVTISSGSLTKTGSGTYNANVTTQGTTTLSVYVNDKLMATKSFRVKRVPDPTARINGQEEGTSRLDKNTLASAGGIAVRMKDFDFNLNVQVASFSLQISKSGELSPLYQSSSNKFTSDMESAIRSCKRGDKIFIDPITAKMPDGLRTLPPIIITIQ